MARCPRAVALVVYGISRGSMRLYFCPGLKSGRLESKTGVDVGDKAACLDQSLDSSNHHF